MVRSIYAGDEEMLTKKKKNFPLKKFQLNWFILAFQTKCSLNTYYFLINKPLDFKLR